MLMIRKNIFRQNCGAIKTMLYPLRYFLFSILKSNPKYNTVGNIPWNTQYLFGVGFFYFIGIKFLRTLGCIQTALLYVSALYLAAS